MSAGLPQRVTLLKQAFGREVLLVDEDGGEIAFVILAEFELDGSHYAALQSPAGRKEGEVEMFRVASQEGEPQLETIEDDEEWELAAEAYDALLFEESGKE
ncbi:DUF1292 domain-containing protein [Paenibacillus albicereus]|uniref:DUF1292 domain-containing protein n=1 Tax=Paenibacillus albicereus TaxID=2726185 RepID=A0A6H2H093_9BACL|nr:DUF1292 domain-containing protein [Paenibacillus albicereus]QJC52836.1 DUF1292 domain-containing protein [Paenibacillus albicereus]